MADAYIGEIRALPYTRVPEGWLRCDGGIYQIVQFQALFSVIWNKFGGNGSSTFGVPNLAGNAALGIGTGPGLTPRQWGQYGGDAMVQLSSAHNPPHQHVLVSAYGDPTQETQAPDAKSMMAILADPNAQPAYSAAPADVTLDDDALTVAGGSEAHENRQPFLGVQFFINYDGEYPVRP